VSVLPWRENAVGYAPRAEHIVAASG